MIGEFKEVIVGQGYTAVSAGVKCMTAHSLHGNHVDSLSIV